MERFDNPASGNLEAEPQNTQKKADALFEERIRLIFRVALRSGRIDRFAMLYQDDAKKCLQSLILEMNTDLFSNLLRYRKWQKSLEDNFLSFFHTLRIQDQLDTQFMRFLCSARLNQVKIIKSLIQFGQPMDIETYLDFSTFNWN